MTHHLTISNICAEYELLFLSILYNYDPYKKFQTYLYWPWPQWDDLGQGHNTPSVHKQSSASALQSDGSNTKQTGRRISIYQPLTFVCGGFKAIHKNI